MKSCDSSLDLPGLKAHVLSYHRLLLRGWKKWGLRWRNSGEGKVGRVCRQQDLSPGSPSVTPKQAPQLMLPGARGPGCKSCLYPRHLWGLGRKVSPQPWKPQVLCAPSTAVRMKWGAPAWALAATGDLGTAERPSKAIRHMESGQRWGVLEPGTAWGWGWIRVGDAVLKVGAPGAPFWATPTPQGDQEV